MSVYANASVAAFRIPEILNFRIMVIQTSMASSWCRLGLPNRNLRKKRESSWQTNDTGGRAKLGSKRMDTRVAGNSNECLFVTAAALDGYELRRKTTDGSFQSPKYVFPTRHCLPLQQAHWWVQQEGGYEVPCVPHPLHRFRHVGLIANLMLLQPPVRVTGEQLIVSYEAPAVPYSVPQC